jgi:tetratricopeptide (TPR) repeat protein/tRNA A-37 threonylcarbamoyl transferase component Bud32
MPTASANRNLLFGILAVQLDFATREQLIKAMNIWILDKARSLGDLLREQGNLSIEELQHLTALVDVHLNRHGNDTQRSLAALSSVESTFQQMLAALPDVDVQATMKQVGMARSEMPAAVTGRVIDQPARLGTEVGRYRILKTHAKGGLGEVFVAEDTELGREVALKQIQDRHADDQASRWRFVLEAEVTGGLEHPGIVPFYGLGSYSDGRPYYAMRFIKGDNLKAAIAKFHANSPRFDSLAFRELLGRFADVCQAVAYAHSRGVLHRDLKPGNIMLGKYGETLVVDWGLAKTTGRRDSTEAGDQTLKPHSGGESSATVAGHALGTPAYMSPEQAAGDWEHLGPASDVHSLGATLYELLTGKPPFATGMIDVLLQDVRSGTFLAPRRVTSNVPKPLEAVCLKAMALTPASRYGSPLALAADVDRWLADEPVGAWREPTSVRFRRWIRKHARLVSGMGAALLVAVAGLALLAWQREQARLAVTKEQAATALERDQKEAAHQQALKSLVQVERGVGLLGSVFKDLDPLAEDIEGKPLRAILGDRLDQATAQLADSVVGDSLAVARLQRILGESQMGLGFPQKAIVLLAKARTTFTSQLGSDDPETLTTLGLLAEGYRLAGNYEAAVPLFEQTFEGFKKKLGPHHASTVIAMGGLGLGYEEAGRLDKAIPLQEKAHEQMKATLGPTHLERLTNMSNLADSYRMAGRPEAAITVLEEALKLRRVKHGPNHPLTLFTMNTLAVTYQDAGKLDVAMPLYEETLKLRRDRLGPDHPNTLTSMNNLGRAYLKAGKVEAALPLLEQTLELRKMKLGPNHPSTFFSMDNLAQGYQTVGRLNDAIRLYEETLKLRTEKLGDDNPDALTTLSNLAGAYYDAGKLNMSMPLYEKAYNGRKSKLGPTHPDTLHSLGKLARQYLAMNNPDRALPLYREYLGAQRSRFEKGPLEFARLQATVAVDLLKHGQPAFAESNLRDCLAIRDKLEPIAWTTFNTQSLLGAALLEQHKYAEAKPLLLAGLAGMQKRVADIPLQYQIRVQEAMERLVKLFEATGKSADATRWKNELGNLKKVTAAKPAESAKP